MASPPAAPPSGHACSRRATLVVVALSVAACVRPPGAKKPSPEVVPVSAPTTSTSPARPTLSGSAAPPTFVRSTADARTTRVLDLREGLTKQVAFRTASEVLGQKYTIDVSDPRAGFLMTTWQASYVREGVPDLRYRTRLILRFLGDEWKQFSVRAEANWQRGDEWEVGYDMALLDEAVTETRDRLGKKPTGPAP